MGIFGKIFGKKRIKYTLKVYDGSQWVEIADGTAASEQDIQSDVNSMIETGVINKNMTYRVEDNKGNVILMNVPKRGSSEDDDEEKYRIEYRDSAGSRWKTYDEMYDEPDFDLIDEIADSGRLPPGSEVRVVHMQGKKKQVVYSRQVKSSINPNGLVADTGNNIVINVEGIRQIKQSIEALKEVRDTLDDVLGDKKPQSTGFSAEQYEGKPPWYLRPDVVQPFMQMIMGSMGSNFVGGGNSAPVKKKNVDDDLNDYLD